MKYAVKIMNKQNMDTSDLELAKTEIEILKICQHPNIIGIHDVYENNDFFYISTSVYNYFSHGLLPGWRTL